MRRTRCIRDCIKVGNWETEVSALLLTAAAGMMNIVQVQKLLGEYSDYY